MKLLYLGFAIVGFISGAILGANIAGNYFVSFEIFGLRGYEAGGLLGGIVVALMFCFLAFAILRRQR